MQIETCRRGKECKLDFKIGYLHSYPNGDLQFENYDYNGKLDNGKFEKRILEKSAMDSSFEKLNSAFSTGAKSVTMASCYMSVRTPNTQAKSKYQSGVLNKTVDNWYNNKKTGSNKSEIYSAFSKGS